MQSTRLDLTEYGPVTYRGDGSSLCRTQDPDPGLAFFAPAFDSRNLTDDQKAKVKDIFADAKTKHQAVSNDTSLSDEQKKAKMKELHNATMAKLNELLTPEQQTELKSKMEAAKAKPPAQP